MNSVQRTDRADADLLDIFINGLTYFGTAQAERYQAALEHAFDLLAENPRMGRAAEAIRPGVHRHECGSHIILYEPTSVGILVLAIVHGSSVNRLAL